RCGPAPRRQGAGRASGPLRRGGRAAGPGGAGRGAQRARPHRRSPLQPRLDHAAPALRHGPFWTRAQRPAARGAARRPAGGRCAAAARRLLPRARRRFVKAMALAAARSDRAVAWSTLLLLSGLALVWGLNWPAMKFVLAEVPVLTFRTLCLWVTGPVL